METLRSRVQRAEELSVRIWDHQHDGSTMACDRLGGVDKSSCNRREPEVDPDTVRSIDMGVPKMGSASGSGAVVAA